MDYYSYCLSYKILVLIAYTSKRIYIKTVTFLFDLTR